MGYDYDKLYGETRDALGPPTKAFVDFFDRLEMKQARVLDVGCGQGRDALFIARAGHRVVGVDLSPNGIRDLTQAAQREGLDIQGQVADLNDYAPDGSFDVVLIDRTLHMLDESERLALLARLLDHVVPNGHVLIADEPSNIAGFRLVIARHLETWHETYAKGGFLFLQRD